MNGFQIGRHWHWHWHWHWHIHLNVGQRPLPMGEQETHRATVYIQWHFEPVCCLYQCTNITMCTWTHLLGTKTWLFTTIVLNTLIQASFMDERERERETDRETDRERQRDRNRKRQRERQRETEKTETERERQTERQRQKDWNTDKQAGRKTGNGEAGKWPPVTVTKSPSVVSEWWTVNAKWATVTEPPPEVTGRWAVNAKWAPVTEPPTWWLGGERWMLIEQQSLNHQPGDLMASGECQLSNGHWTTTSGDWVVSGECKLRYISFYLHLAYVDVWQQLCVVNVYAEGIWNIHFTLFFLCAELIAEKSCVGKRMHAMSPFRF